MTSEQRSRNPRSAAVPAENQPQRHRNLAAPPLGIRGVPCVHHPCGWCSAHTAALREKFSRRAQILQSFSAAQRSRNQGGEEDTQSG